MAERIDHSILIALCIAIFDILPVLGTGGIMIPWTILSAIQGDYTLAIGLLAVYLVVTVIRTFWSRRSWAARSACTLW